MMDVLTRYREELDRIDVELVQGLSRRLRLCETIARHKRDAGIPMMQPHRVEHVLERCVRLGASLGLSPDFVAELYRRIIAEACHVEERTMAEPKGERPA